MFEGSLRMMENRFVLLWIVPLLWAGMGCAVRTETKDLSDVSAAIEDRTGHSVRGEGENDFALPPGVSLEQGVGAEDAVAIALWNNAAFRADLSSLGLVRADLVQAGLLKNPVLSLLLPWGPKQFEATASWPLEALWERPKRVEKASLNVQAAANRLVHSGIDLVCRVRLLHAELQLAQDQVTLAEEALALERDFLELTEARLREGDISGMEATAVGTAVGLAEETLDRSRFAVELAEGNLRLAMGVGAEHPRIRAVAQPFQLSSPVEIAELLNDAMAARPDLRAAEILVESAGVELGLAEETALRLTAILDINGEGKQGFEAGPGVLAELPVFDRHQGAQSKARAVLEQAMAEYVAAQHRVAAEVREALSEFGKASAAYNKRKNEILPSLELFLKQSETAFAQGEVPYLTVIEGKLQLVDARRGQVQAVADLRKAAAKLDRATGRTRFGQ